MLRYPYVVWNADNLGGYCVYEPKHGDIHQRDFVAGHSTKETLENIAAAFTKLAERA